MYIPPNQYGSFILNKFLKANRGASKETYNGIYQHLQNEGQYMYGGESTNEDSKPLLLIVGFVILVAAMIEIFI